MLRLSLTADGRRLTDEHGVVIAMCDDPATADQIAKSVNDVDKIAEDLEALLVAAGLDYARSWAPHEAFQEVARQIRMVRQTVAGGHMARIEKSESSWSGR